MSKVSDTSVQVVDEMNKMREESLQKKWKRKTPLELALHLSAGGSFSVNSEEGLILTNMDTADFIDAALAKDPQSKMEVFVKMLSRFSLGLKIEGSISIGQQSLSDHSWVFLAGESGSFTISLAQPPMLRRSISDMVSFLSLLPQGQGFVLKGGQDFLLEGLTPESMLAYYETCISHEDATLREKAQDVLFEQNCPLLQEKGMSLKIFGANAQQVDRHIDAKAGGIFFHTVAKDIKPMTALVFALVPKKV